MMKIRLEPYKYWSGGAKALAERLGVLRATKRQVEKHGDFDLIINWGRNERRFKGEYINNPEAVSKATSKLASAKCFRDHSISQPPFTTNRGVAEAWRERGSTVISRTLLRANSGRGIIIRNPEDTRGLPQAPLYTKYIKKTEEYRVHVFGGHVIDVQMKRKREEVPNEEVNYQIRNAHNGWVYCRNNVTLPDCVRDNAVRAVDALGLDMGAVDVGFNAKREKCRVYEVNTAPGLEGTTLDSYYNALTDAFPELQGGAYARRRQ